MNRDRGFTRREWLLSLPALGVARHVLAQAGAARLRARALNHLALRVSDPKRSIEFYQSLLGLPIHARQGETTVLRIGTGPQSLAVVPAGSNPPRINHLGMSIDDFDAARIVRVLAQHGVARVEDAADGSLSVGAMKVRVSRRGPEAGGASGGTPEVFFGDPDGVVVQLQDVGYCGGAGSLGNSCSPQATPPKGPLAVRDLSHFTIMGVADAQKSNAFYQALFGFPIRANQGASPLLGVGSGVQFVMFVGGGGAARAASTRRPAGGRIDHACLNMDGFNVDQILKTLEGFGIKPRGTNPLGPMMSYVSMRMENRGGAPGGTPELYFTDPDGLLIQLQDSKYCGGGGYLGDVCLA